MALKKPESYISRIKYLEGKEFHDSICKDERERIKTRFRKVFDINHNLDAMLDLIDNKE